MFLPPVDLQGGWPLAAARGATVIGLLSAFGTLLFRVQVAPRVFARMPPDSIGAFRRWSRGLAHGSFWLAAAGLLAWAFVQSATMADASTLSQTVAALPDVLLRTRFGHVLLLQLAVLAALALLLRRPASDLNLRLSCAAAALAVILQTGHSHAESMYQRPSLLLLADVVHLLAAGAWLGGLLPLLALIRVSPPEAGATACRRFSPLGMLCVASLAITALFQGVVLVASPAGLIGTAYGWMILVKLALFAALLGFAHANRYRFAPRLSGGTEAAKTPLIRSIALQTGVAATILAAAVMLSALPPAMHGQPLWPFADRISFDAINEDPDFFWEVTHAAALLGASLLFLVAAFLFRRARIVAVCTLALAAWFTVPHFDLLLVPAYPTSFFTSPTGFSADSIVAGAELFPSHCAACHGATGAGNGPLAKTLPVPPADLTAAHLWMHSDGELFWWLTAGIRTPEGRQAMPGFARVLDEDQRWALIDEIRANNAGRMFAAMNDWDRPTQAPGFAAECAGKTRQLADLRGEFVRLTIGAPAAPPPNLPGLVSIATQNATAPDPGLCLARDETLAQAYAVVTGQGAGNIAGWQFLIDPDGFLRAVQRPDAKPGWDDRNSLQAELTSLRTHKTEAKSGASEKMNMPM